MSRRRKLDLIFISILTIENIIVLIYLILVSNGILGPVMDDRQRMFGLLLYFIVINNHFILMVLDSAYPIAARELILVMKLILRFFTQNFFGLLLIMIIFGVIRFWEQIETQWLYPWFLKLYTLITNLIEERMEYWRYLLLELSIIYTWADNFRENMPRLLRIFYTNLGSFLEIIARTWYRLKVIIANLGERIFNGVWGKVKEVAKGLGTIIKGIWEKAWERSKEILGLNPNESKPSEENNQDKKETESKNSNSESPEKNTDSPPESKKNGNNNSNYKFQGL